MDPLDATGEAGAVDLWPEEIKEIVADVAQEAAQDFRLPDTSVEVCFFSHDKRGLCPVYSYVSDPEIIYIWVSRDICKKADVAPIVWGGFYQAARIEELSSNRSKNIVQGMTVCDFFTRGLSYAFEVEKGFPERPAFTSLSEDQLAVYGDFLEGSDLSKGHDPHTLFLAFTRRNALCVRNIEASTLIADCLSYSHAKAWLNFTGSTARDALHDCPWTIMGHWGNGSLLVPTHAGLHSDIARIYSRNLKTAPLHDAPTFRPHP